MTTIEILQFFSFKINSFLFLQFNDAKVALPFITEDQEVSIVQEGVFIEIRTIGFLLKYYPGLFKFFCIVFKFSVYLSFN